MQLEMTEDQVFCDHRFIEREALEDIYFPPDYDVWVYRCPNCRAGFWVPQDIQYLELNLKDKGFDDTINVLYKILEKKEKYQVFNNEKLEAIANKLVER